MTETIVPIFPSRELPDNFFWPIDNRRYLADITLENLEQCSMLSGQQGLADGSGKSDALIYRAGNWCLKTSLRNKFNTIEEGYNALTKLSKKKAALSSLLPPKTILVLQPENKSSCWLWTLTPWYKTLRSLMVEAIENNNETILAASLQAFARVAIDAIILTSQQNISLDIHPSNFALPNYQTNSKINLLSYESIVYLDDDIMEVAECLTIGYALLRRIDEFEKWEKAINLYLLTMEDAISNKLSQSDIKKLRLVEAFQGIPVRTIKAQEFTKHIISVIKECRSFI